MNNLEQHSIPEEAPDLDFGMNMDDFDIDAAFHEALHGIATDEELALEEKVQRMEAVISQGTNEIYQEFVNLRSMARQLELFCSHDDALNQAFQASDTLSTFMDSFRDDPHDHSENKSDHHDRDKNKESKTKKKKKKKQFNLFGIEIR